jgi:cysteine synthase B
MSSATAAAGVRPSVLDQVGNTPLLHLGRISQPFNNVEIWAKAEYLNPGGSVKDRPALAMILDGERRGLLGPDRTLLDATSGNTGIAYAMICAARGYRARICIPENASGERLRTLRAYGVDLELTDAGAGSDGSILRCREIYASNPSLYFYPDQYSNPANWRAHYETTGPEILRQTEGRITHFVAAVGTCGTFVGTSRRLKSDSPRVRCVSVQPSSGFHGIEGTRNLASALVPSAIYDASLADATLFIETEEAYAMTRRLAREEGLLVGVSAGANIAAAVRTASDLAAQNRAGLIATILCDGGGKYLTEEFWSDPH